MVRLSNLPMILFFGVIVLAIVAGLVAGGSIRRFTELRLRWWLLAPVGFALQAIPLPDGRHGGDLAIRMTVFGVSYVLVLAFAIRNRRIAGVPLIVAGLLLNGLVVTANGGMPVSRSAIVASGQADKLDLLVTDDDAKHHLLGPSDVLTPLGDVIATPQPLGEIVSVGDVLVYAGLLWLILAVMRGQTDALARPAETEPYQGRHRRRFRSKATAEVAAPAAATMSGTEP
jgi:uncharacterized protein DUF5317